MIGTFLVGVAMILENNGQILIGKRSADKDFGRDLWELPSGRLNKGEDPEIAIQREGMEELGISITVKYIIDAYGFKRNEHDMILLTYVCEHSGKITRSDEHSELRWVSPAEAKQRFSFKQQRQTIDKYLQSR